MRHENRCFHAASYSATVITKGKSEPLRVFVIGIIIIDKTFNMHLVLPAPVTVDVELSM